MAPEEPPVFGPYFGPKSGENALGSDVGDAILRDLGRYGANEELLDSLPACGSILTSPHPLQGRLQLTHHECAASALQSPQYDSRYVNQMQGPLDAINVH